MATDFNEVELLVDNCKCTLLEFIESNVMDESSRISVESLLEVLQLKIGETTTPTLTASVTRIK